VKIHQNRKKERKKGREEEKKGRKEEGRKENYMSGSTVRL
jgi:hypothetical protein